MKKLLTLLGGAALGASLCAAPVSAQVIRNAELIGNGGNYGCDKLDYRSINDDG